MARELMRPYKFGGGALVEAIDVEQQALDAYQEFLKRRRTSPKCALRCS
jgi:hypothetical protein